MKINGGRAVEGVLRGFDPFMNLVIDETTEYKKDGRTNSIGMVVVRRNSVVMLEAKDRVWGELGYNTNTAQVYSTTKTPHNPQLKQITTRLCEDGWRHFYNIKCMFKCKFGVNENNKCISNKHGFNLISILR